MSSYPALKIPEAWKPLFKALDDAGWQLEGPMDEDFGWECSHILRFIEGGKSCFLSIWDESEWCGNNSQKLGLTVVGLSFTMPKTSSEAEEYCLVLTADWEMEVGNFVDTFLERQRAETGLIH